MEYQTADERDAVPKGEDMDQLLETSATELVRLIADRQLSSRELTEVHLRRIEAVNGPINAVVTLEAEAALEQARTADNATAAGEPLGRLHGLPMTHKDTHMVAGMRSTKGSPVLAEHVPDEDDLIIARLRQAGVVSTGKTNVPEFAAGSHTFNDVFGTTRNPYDTTASAGGSSGGVAAALAARIQPLGDGSDMGGSLRIPASYCNVYGFRPSYGVIPTFSAQNLATWLARTGPMARRVEDLELFMGATVGPVPELPWLHHCGGHDFESERVQHLKGVRVAVTTDFGLGVPVEPEMQAAVERAAEILADCGADVEPDCPGLMGADEIFHVTRAFDFVSSLGETVADHRDQVKPEILWNVAQGHALTAERLARVQKLAATLQAHLHEFFTKYDLLLSPGAQLLPFDAEIRYPQTVAGQPMATYLEWMRSASIISATELPTLAMPAGFSAPPKADAGSTAAGGGSGSTLAGPSSGLPTGVQLTAWHQTDAQLLAWARCYDAHDTVRTWTSTVPGDARR